MPMNDAHAVLAEVCREKGNTDWAMHHAMMIAEAFTELRFKVLWEAPALHGKKRLDSLAEGRDSANMLRAASAAAQHKEWQEEANKVWVRHPSLSKMAVAKIIAKQFPSHAISTIRKAIKKVGKAG